MLVLVAVRADDSFAECRTLQQCLSDLNSDPGAAQWLVDHGKSSLLATNAILEAALNSPSTLDTVLKHKIISKIGELAVDAIGNNRGANNIRRFAMELHTIIDNAPTATDRLCNDILLAKSPIFLEMFASPRMKLTPRCIALLRAIAVAQGEPASERALEILAQRNVAEHDEIVTEIMSACTAGQRSDIQACVSASLLLGREQNAQALQCLHHIILQKERIARECALAQLVTHEPATARRSVEAVLMGTDEERGYISDFGSSGQGERTMAKLSIIANDTYSPFRLAATASLATGNMSAAAYQIPAGLPLPTTSSRQQHATEHWMTLLCDTSVDIASSGYDVASLFNAIFMDVGDESQPKPSSPSPETSVVRRGRPLLRDAIQCLHSQYVSHIQVVVTRALAASPSPKWLGNVGAAVLGDALDGDLLAQMLLRQMPIDLAIYTTYPLFSTQLESLRHQISNISSNHLIALREPLRNLSARLSEKLIELEDGIDPVEAGIQQAGRFQNSVNALMRSVNHELTYRDRERITGVVAEHWQVMLFIAALATNYLILLCLWVFHPELVLNYGRWLQMQTTKLIGDRKLARVPTDLLLLIFVPPFIKYGDRALRAWMKRHIRHRPAISSPRQARMGYHEDVQIELDAFVARLGSARKVRLCFTGEGGSGKTTELMHIASRLHADQGLWGGDVLGVMIDAADVQKAVLQSAGTANFLYPMILGKVIASDDVIAEIEPNLATKRTNMTLVARLMGAGRIAVLCDGVTEWPRKAFDHLEQLCESETVARIVMTARSHLPLGRISGLSIVAIPLLSGTELVTFALSCCRTNYPDLDEAEVLRICTRMVSQLGGALTALTVTMYLQLEANVGTSKYNVQRPLLTVRDVFLEYLAFLNRYHEETRPTSRVQRDVALLAWQCWWHDQTPSSISREGALAVLSTALPDANDARDRLEHLISDLRVLQHVGSDRNLVRFSLDPLCESMAAEHVALLLMANTLNVANAELNEIASRESLFTAALGRALAAHGKSLAMFLQGAGRASNQSVDIQMGTEISYTSHDVALSQDLLRAFRERRLALFVGSGASLSSDVAGTFPRWGELASRLLNVVENVGTLSAETIVGKRAQFGQPMSLEVMLAELGTLKVALGRDYQRALNELFRPRDAAPGAIHMAIVETDVQAILTTNYDNLIERADKAGYRQVYTWKQAEKVLLDLREQRRVLFKVHGSAEDHASVVMTLDEYRQVNEAATYRAVLSYLAQTCSFLFIGYGMNDPLDLDLALKTNQNIFRESAMKHFALLRAANTSDIERLYREYNVQVISYSEHSELPGILARIRSGQ